ncbi:unnamed protein product, partial [marine sediment metagenome]
PSKNAHKQKIDFLSVDCEGYDLRVLQSMEWARYDVDLICTECNTCGKYLGLLGYRLCANTRGNLFYARDKKNKVGT